ncbi:MAG: polyketide cyclase [Proteobacteria bacterium]|nr:polyketide cyclase [Pseudomonadota bacterium]
MTVNGPNGTAEREIRSSRVFDASRERLFEAWSDPEHLASWWGPKDFTNTFQEFDLRPGGIWRFVMHGPDGTDYPNESIFVEVVDPERIVFRHISAPSFQMTAIFTEQCGKTRLEWRMLFDTAVECEKFRRVCVPGNEQNFDRLEAQLTKMAAQA